MRMKKILIVDDMLVSLMMTENMLCGHYITFSASSGQEAIEIYRREHPDMVLSDLRMPGMSGYELQQTLQKEMQSTNRPQTAIRQLQKYRQQKLPQKGAKTAAKISL